MANSYVITLITHQGDNATVYGTVNGVQVCVLCSWSEITAQPNVTAFEDFVSPLMLAVYNTITTPIPINSDTTHNNSWSL
jgi:hypothetical protein